MKEILSQEQIKILLKSLYDNACTGLAGSKSCINLAEEYLNKYPDTKIAANKFIDSIVAKCTTSGFLASIGGAITLPIGIPANIASVIYMQLRMIVTLACMSGLNPDDDEVESLCYLCLTGSAMADTLKAAGVKIANKTLTAALQKLPGTALIQINKAVGFRLLTKFGTNGIINLGKTIPIVGGVVGGTVDLVRTKIVAKKAYKVFIENK